MENATDTINNVLNTLLAIEKAVRQFLLSWDHAGNQILILMSSQIRNQLSRAHDAISTLGKWCWPIDPVDWVVRILRREISPRVFDVGSANIHS